METPTEQSPEQRVEKTKYSQRIIGGVMVIGSGVLGYLAIILPLLAASRHEEDVTISMKGVVFVPALFGVGLMLIFTGDRPSQVFGTKQKPSVLGWAVCIVMAGLGIVLYEWLKRRLRDYGYGF